MMMPAAGTPCLKLANLAIPATHNRYTNDEDGVVPKLEALISFLLAELAFETRSWFDTRYLTRGTMRPTAVLHYESWACN